MAHCRLVASTRRAAAAAAAARWRSSTRPFTGSTSRQQGSNPRSAASAVAFAISSSTRISTISSRFTTRTTHTWAAIRVSFDSSQSAYLAAAVSSYLHFPCSLLFNLPFSQRRSGSQSSTRPFPLPFLLLLLHRQTFQCDISLSYKMAIWTAHIQLSRHMKIPQFNQHQTRICEWAADWIECNSMETSLLFIRRAQCCIHHCLCL